MKIQLVVKPEVLIDAFPQMERQDTSTDAEHLITASGRLCYQSFHRPNEVTRLDADYIQRTIIEQGHESVAEHASVSFYVEGISRNTLLELERHRHLSFSVISGRFCPQSAEDLVIPPALRGTGSAALWDAVDRMKSAAQECYDLAVAELMYEGATRKQAREAARAFLPSALETKFVVTGNLRAWRYVCRLRTDPSADAEIQEFAREVLRILKSDVAPSVFSDMSVM